LAIMAANVAAVASVCIGAAFKISQKYNLSVGDYQIFRSSYMLLLMTPIMLLTKHDPWTDLEVKSSDDNPPTERIKLLTIFLRSMFSVGFFLMSMWSLQMLPLALNTVLTNLTPFWTSLLAHLINGEEINKLEYVAMAVCFGFVVVFALKRPVPDSFEEHPDHTLFGIILCLCASILNASRNILNRRLQGTHFSVVSFWHGSLGLAITGSHVALYAAIMHSTFLQYENKAYFWILLGVSADLIDSNFKLIAF
jgi:drug/metabolite transporter (DMT)-like permease